MENNKIVSIENTRFIFETNFSGDPRRDKFGSDKRYANIIIPEELAEELTDEGFNVRHTDPKDSEYEKTYFVKAAVNYDSKFPPRIFLVSGDNPPELLDIESVGVIDTMYIRNVNVILSKYYNAKIDKWSLYVRTMYVEQELCNDPFAARYRR